MCTLSCADSESALRSVSSGYVVRANSFEIGENFSRIDSAHVHLASVDAE